MKTLTRKQVEQRKEQDDPERAAEIEDESLEDYAARKRIQIQNPVRRLRMASKRELEQQVEELEEEVDALNDRLDEITDLAAPEEEEEEEVEETVPNRRR
jgi:uncharacterized protein YceH (UPF0502 family)